MHFHEVSSLIVLAAFALGGFLFARHYGSGTALQELERANRILEKRVRELEESDVRKTSRIAELEAATDVSQAMAPVVDLLVRHEVAAEARTVKTLNLLSLIADRLGPDQDLAREGGHG